MASLARVLPGDAAVVEEAVTTTNTYLERLGAIRNASGYFGHRGWALGWGLGCAVGVKLAWPDRPVLAILGEGAALYGIQGLWTAARHKLPVTFVIANNSQYQILKVGAQQLRLPQANRGKFVGLDLREPEIDVVALSRSLGVEAHTVQDGDELADRVQASLTGNVPRLFNVPIDRKLPGKMQY
jgi:benzoylformate decarboxylase